MKFDIELKQEALPSCTYTVLREAVRAVSIKGEKVLLIQTKDGDVKFPGGGVEASESHTDTLLREIIEETGYIRSEVLQKAGVVVEVKEDEFNQNQSFQMTSHYYWCNIHTDVRTCQQLDRYETDLSFKPVWLTIEEAIEMNEQAQNLEISWLERETAVLKALRK
ncbi:NUDIX domain-containing protein [Halobacillus litoralis]|uniref:NUDIX domain-containing protein n=1 Tax=Halobacillus litoralis TaxID=45668 RepID=UPI001CD7D057|nr:NUDIX domain-containing protein [Halobacillus litoralis]MCA0969235.1 NUDIX domain-containing protein [Halobacillus litoralis]